MPQAPLEPIVKRLADHLRPVTKTVWTRVRSKKARKILRIAGWTGSGSIALSLATIVALWATALLLKATGLSPSSEPLSHLLVYGAPTTIGAAVAFAQTVPAIAAVATPAAGALAGGALGAYRGARRAVR